MQIRILPRMVFLLVLSASIVLTLDDDNSGSKDINMKLKNPWKSDENHYRIRRAVRRPGFFRTLFSVIYEQWNDTRNTISQVRSMVNDNFLDENAPKVEVTTSSDPNATTTEVPYKITRTEFNKIIQRNLKGLVRLYNLELKDALKQSDRNYADFRKNASLEVSKFL